MDYEQNHHDQNQHENNETEYDTGCHYKEDSESAPSAHTDENQDQNTTPDQTPQQLAAHKKHESARQGNELLTFINSIESELTQLRAASVEQNTLIETNDQRSAQIDEQQNALQSKAHELNTQAETLATQRAACDEQTAQLETNRTELAQRATELDEAEGQINEWRAGLTSEAEQLNQQKSAHDQTRQSFEDQRQNFVEQQDQVEIRSRELDEQSRAINDRQQELNQQAETLAAQSQTLADEQQALESQRQELAEQTQQTQTTRTELAAQSQANSERTEELTTEWDRLDTERADCETDRQSLTTQAEQLNRRRDSIQVAGDQLAREKMNLAEDRATLEADNRILTQEHARLEDLQSQPAADPAAASDPQAQQALEELEAELEKREQAITTLANHFRKIQTELTAAENQNAQQAAELENLAAQNTSTAQPNQQAALRRQRLKHQRQLIKTRTTQNHESKYEHRVRTDAVEQIAAERELLVEVRTELATAEKRMIRKWAHATVVTRLFLFVATILLLAGACYIGTMQFVPARYIASATVSAQARAGFPMTADQTQTWQTVNDELVLSASVIDAAAQRLGQRGFDNLKKPADLTTYLQNNLTATSTTAGSIELSLVGQGAQDTERILETFAITLVSTSNATRSKRTDGAKTQLLAPATIDPKPIKDDRLIYASIAFGSSVFLLIPLGTFLASKLKKVSQVFDTTGELFDEPDANDKRWQSIRNNTDGIVTEHVIE